MELHGFRASTPDTLRREHVLAQLVILTGRKHSLASTKALSPIECDKCSLTDCCVSPNMLN